MFIEQEKRSVLCFLFKDMVYQFFSFFHSFNKLTVLTFFHNLTDQCLRFFIVRVPCWQFSASCIPTSSKKSELFGSTSRGCFCEQSHNIGVFAVSGYTWIVAPACTPGRYHYDIILATFGLACIAIDDGQQ